MLRFTIYSLLLFGFSVLSNLPLAGNSASIFLLLFLSVAIGLALSNVLVHFMRRNKEVSGYGQIFFLAVVIIALYFRSNLFFVYDEWFYLARLRDEGLKSIFVFHNEHFAPLFFALYSLEVWLFRDHYSLYLLVSIFLHLLNACLYWKLLHAIFPGATRVTSLMTFLFALSSLHVEVLHWAFEQCLLMGVSLTLIAWLGALEYLEVGRLRALCAMSIACVAAPLCFANGFLAALLIPVLAIFRMAFESASQPLLRRRAAHLFLLSFGLGVPLVTMYASLSPSTDALRNYMLSGILNYVYVGSQLGTVLRGIGLFPPLQLDTAATIGKQFSFSPQNSELFFASLGLLVSFFILWRSRRLSVENKRFFLRTWMLGQIVIAAALVLPAFGRSALGAMQSLSLRYHYLALMGLGVTLLPLVQAHFEQKEFDIQRTSLVICYFISLQFFFAGNFSFFTVAANKTWNCMGRPIVHSMHPDSANDNECPPLKSLDYADLTELLVWLRKR